MLTALALSAVLETGYGPWKLHEVTGYSWKCGATQRTASGVWPEINWSAASSKEDYPFGTVLQLSYRGITTTRIVHDRGPDITKGKLDLMMADCDRARVWGRKKIWVREVRRPLGARSNR
jgi:3D (Asp-Asp-Asp) domain-containing protein